MIIPRRPVRTLRVPRKQRAQRFQWRTGASMNGYLIEHPEREIAEPNVLRLTWECRACGVIRTFSATAVLLSPAAALGECIASAHLHNARRHPRRWARSQHFQAPIPIEVRNRAACTCVEDVVCGPCMTGAVA